MSQEELGVRAGVTRATISRLEKPDAPEPSLRTQRSIARVLNVDPDLLWPLQDVNGGEPERVA